MILRQLVLQNFGVYLGRQVIDLAPPSPQKPIVLLGALNGGGKTTLLDALQLVLYGQLAQCSNRGDLAYDEFLRRSIHRRSDPHQGAAIELEFTRVSEGEESTYRIRRAWVARGKSVKEHLEVTRDGALDPVLTEAWAEYIEELIPVRLSKFFFFDGEKIEALADLDRATDALSTAIHSLLGLDLVDQLGTDLAVLERRKRSQHSASIAQQAIESAQSEVNQLAAERDTLNQQLAATQNVVDRTRKRFREAEEKFKHEGGDAFKRRQEVQLAQANVKNQLDHVKEELREEAAGITPLMIASALLGMVARDHISERGAIQAADIWKLLEDRDARVVETAKSVGATASVLTALAEFLAEDRDRYTTSSKVEPYLNLSTEMGSELYNIQARLRGEVPERLRRLLEQQRKLQLKLQELDRRLERVPDEEMIRKLETALVEARENLTRAEHDHEALREEHERITREHEQKLISLKRRKEKVLDEELKQEAIARLLIHSERGRRTLKTFREVVLKRNVGRIQRLVLDGFQHLLRKNSLVADIRIDPASFTMTLIGPDGRGLLPERLSAGERQLLAISTIWGLARTAARPLPVVIDTPLGRLDSAHRLHLVERYFPVASHQVLLLSTDKEIDEDLYAKLKPSIGRAYTLSFDDREGSTSVIPGYFW